MQSTTAVAIEAEKEAGAFPTTILLLPLIVQWGKYCNYLCNYYWVSDSNRTSSLLSGV